MSSMRSRSSRFFVVLLHLVGCPQHFHHTFEGIVGVQPSPILLETFSPSAFLQQQSHQQSRERPEPVWLQDVATQTCLGPQGTFTADCGDATLWLPVQQRVLLPSRRRERALMGLTGIDEDDASIHKEDNGSEESAAGRRKLRNNDKLNNHNVEALVFYLVDRDVDEILDLTTSAYQDQVGRWWRRWNPVQLWKQHQRHRQALPLECLTYDPDQGILSIKLCDAMQHGIPRTAALPQWAWRIPTHDSSLRPAGLAPASSTMEASKPKNELDSSDASGDVELDQLCASLLPATDSFSTRHNVRLAECKDGSNSSRNAVNNNTPRATSRNGEQQIEVTLVRYMTKPAREVTTTKASPFHLENEKAEQSKRKVASDDIEHAASYAKVEHQNEGSKGESIESSDTSSSSSGSSLPKRNLDLAHLAALDMSMHPELPSRPRLLFEKRIDKVNVQEENTSRRRRRVGGKATSSSNSRNVQIKRNQRLAALHNASPILLVGDVRSSSSDFSGGHSDREDSTYIKSNNNGDAFASQQSSLHHRKMRIPVHPYIAACKDEVWTDPQTGLEYPTDLSSYLGYDRKEKGRHTLMGVGQYRKGYVIKVYGIAYYVSKRDVLADPFFEKYADMSAQELRQHPEFFDHLRLHPENFERSLFIKTNMQLSAEAIRGSLQADWSMLTEEAKNLILESSMRPQAVDQRTLAIIQDANNNPSKCSCESIAPEQYHADRSCCARGTELVFTWLKNGDVVCRLNGRLVDVFSRPDIAEGIFFEYLRNDDPISSEFHDNVVNGFPFLLAPLTQVQGLHQHATPKSSKSFEEGSDLDEDEDRRFDIMQLVSHAFMQLGDSVGSQAASLTEAVQRSMANTVGHVQQGTGAIWDSVRTMSDELGKDLTRRRDEFIKRAANVPEAIATSLKRNPVHFVQEWIGRFTAQPPLLEAQNMQQELVKSDDVFDAEHAAQAQNRRLLLSRWLGDAYHYAPDEIGPMIIHPTMNMTRKIFLFLVHLYLLLLFIVSFPGSYSTRTKFVYCRRTRKLRRLSSSSSLILESDSAPLCYVDDHDGDYDDDYEEEDEEEQQQNDVREREERLTSYQRSSSSSVSVSSPPQLPFSPGYVRRGLLKYPM